MGILLFQLRLIRLLHILVCDDSYVLQDYLTKRCGLLTSLDRVTDNAYVRLVISITIVIVETKTSNNYI